MVYILMRKTCIESMSLVLFHVPVSMFTASLIKALFNYRELHQNQLAQIPSFTFDNIPELLHL